MTTGPSWAYRLLLAHANLEEDFASGPLEESNWAYFRNRAGLIRRVLVRDIEFHLDEEIDRAELKRVYQTWRDEDEYLVMDGVLEGTNETLTVVRKARKRGNDVDVSAAAIDLEGYSRALEPFAGNGGCTQLLYTTWTVNGEISASSSWDIVGEAWNRQLSLLRSRFGRLLVLRSWETTESGRAHVHALLAFLDYAFADLFEWNGKVRVRSMDRDLVRDGWSLGFVDVQAVIGLDSLAHRVHDVLWYVAGSLVGSKEDLNRAVLWYLGKRAFSVSKGLRERALLYDSIRRDDDLLSVTQTAPRVRWVRVGMIAASATSLDPKTWAAFYTEYPKWIGEVTWRWIERG
jgi:hypothetical protein